MPSISNSRITSIHCLIGYHQNINFPLQIDPRSSSIIFNFSFNDKREEIIDMHMIFEFIARDMVKIYARKFLK